LDRSCLCWLTATLAVLAFTAAEPYARYLSIALPAAAYLSARALSRLAGGRSTALAALVVVALAANTAFVLPLKAAQAVAAPSSPAETVSGMMRQRLRDAPFRSDLFSFARETWHGGEGYVEPVAAAMASCRETSFFSDSDALSIMFATGQRPVYPEEFKSFEPDWIVPSPWLRLTPDAAARIDALAVAGRYERVQVEAPRLLWQNNPDPLFHDYAARRGPLALLKRRVR
jgi:hypothetical protein